MQFSSPLQQGRLIQRYKRFLADIKPNILQNNAIAEEVLTIHCPNTGKMTGCAEPGWAIYYSTSHNTKRKYAHTWELVENPQGDFICVNTVRANQLVGEALQQRTIATLAHYGEIKAEQAYGSERSRIDFLLRQTGEPDCYVEVKSVTLLDNDVLPGATSWLSQGQGFFPDTQSVRAQKHVRELMACVQDGQRAVLLFCVLHTGIKQVSPAHHLDPVYGSLVSEAMAMGVECIAWRADISPTGMQLVEPLPFIV
ncbi:DNA/RNA nuclease SfsA [Oceanisphaera pacifica]|uniref:Sugar fermentation stimulation protein homolog n=1 Tax=Oceanisphaera pacifica TaxID=2818389 RepID=A0ABS3NIG9_9GAMM|nr:DNA/RNA nuclease SfsA [Oceanisphaera pacifica]